MVRASSNRASRLRARSGASTRAPRGPVGLLRVAAVVLGLAAFAIGGRAQERAEEAATPTLGARGGASRVGLHVSGEPVSAARELRALFEQDLDLVPEIALGPSGSGRGARAYVRPHGEGFVVSLDVDASGDAAPLFVSHRGTLREAGHAAARDLVLAITGERPALEGRLAFARREAGRRKQIWVTAWDGYAPRRVSSERHTSLLPGFVGDVLWWSVLEPHRSYLTHEHAADGVVMESGGTDMGIASCGEGLVLSSSRSGDAEVWRARADGSALRRLTEHAGIDVSPSCAADRVAFVSDREGGPRVYLARLGEEGLSEIEAVTGPGETQTPSLCASPRGLRLAYTRLGGAMRVEVLDVARGQRRVISPPGWAAKDPSFSPDCRFLAYVARGRGVVVASVEDPTRHRVVVPGEAETVRWGPPPASLPTRAFERADALAAPR